MIVVPVIRETVWPPICSALSEQCTGGLVVRWFTSSEHPLLYIFDFSVFKD